MPVEKRGGKAEQGGGSKGKGSEVYKTGVGRKGLTKEWGLRECAGVAGRRVKRRGGPQR